MAVAFTFAEYMFLSHASPHITKTRFSCNATPSGQFILLLLSSCSTGRPFYFFWETYSIHLLIYPILSDFLPSTWISINFKKSPPPSHGKTLLLSSSFIRVSPFIRKARVTRILFHLPLATVLEVIELGISGTKSQSKTTEPVVMKDKKISQPASRRVRDAAESLLCSLMEQVDFYTVHCGAESLSSTIGKSKV